MNAPSIALTKLQPKPLGVTAEHKAVEKPLDMLFREVFEAGILKDRRCYLAEVALNKV